MKKISVLFAAAAALMVSSNGFAGGLVQDSVHAQLKALVAAEMQNKNAINWHVGEHAEYKINAMNMDIGEMHMTAERDEGNFLWIKQEITGMQAQTVEEKLDRADGKVVDYIVNGQHQSPPNDTLNIVSQDEQSVTVPAGTFDAVHIVATTNNAQVKQMEIWVNPRDIVLMGMAQTKIDTSQGISVMIQLATMGH